MKKNLSSRRSGHYISAVICGLDIHEESTYVTVLGPDGNVLVRGRIPNQDIHSFLGPIKVYKVAMEVCMHIIPMYRRLVEKGYHVTVSHPKNTRCIAVAHIKSDQVDSRALAELQRLDSLSRSNVCKMEHFARKIFL